MRERWCKSANLAVHEKSPISGRETGRKCEDCEEWEAPHPVLVDKRAAHYELPLIFILYGNLGKVLSYPQIFKDTSEIYSLC